MKNFLFLLAFVMFLTSCTKDSSVPTSEQKARKEKAQLSLSSVSLTAGEDDVVSIGDISFGQGEGIYSNYQGFNVHATAHVDGNVYLQVLAEGIWNSLLATSSTSGFDGFPTSTTTRVYRAMLIATDGSIHYSSEVQVN
jgi:hypothetical protein